MCLVDPTCADKGEACGRPGGPSGLVPVKCCPNLKCKIPSNEWTGTCQKRKGTIVI